MIRTFAPSAALTLALTLVSAARGQSPAQGPQCREAKQNAIISGSAAGVAAGTCFATKSPAACAGAGIAAVKFAADAQKMIHVCQPKQTQGSVPPRVAPPVRRGR